MLISCMKTISVLKQKIMTVNIKKKKKRSLWYISSKKLKGYSLNSARKVTGETSYFISRN